MIPSLLAAAPPPPPEVNPLSIALAAIGGIGTVFTFVAWIVRTLGSRVVQNEDAERKSMRDAQKETNERLVHISEALVQIRADAKATAGDVSALRGQLTETRQTLDQRIEKSGQSHQGEIAKLRDEIRKEMQDLEYRLRADFSRAAADTPVKGRRGRA